MNDLDGMICNFWRAVQHDPNAVAKHADLPCFENDLHARHAWLVGQKESLQTKLEGNPDWFDAKIAGWWCWGACSWIGSGFCSGNGPWQVVEDENGNRNLLHVGNAGMGVNRNRIHIGDAGMGVNRNLLHVGNAGMGGIYDWMIALCERFRYVRVCCGDWRRVCGGKDGDAIRLFFASGGTAAIFLDPPYADTADRTEGIYSEDSTTVAHDVREWALTHGNDKRLRIALCGYEGEHEMPSDWECMSWKAKGGYSNVSDNDDAQSKKNTRKERVWFSPHCLKPVVKGFGIK